MTAFIKIYIYFSSKCTLWNIITRFSQSFLVFWIIIFYRFLSCGIKENENVKVEKCINTIQDRSFLGYSRMEGELKAPLLYLKSVTHLLQSVPYDETWHSYTLRKEDLKNIYPLLSADINILSHEISNFCCMGKCRLKMYFDTFFVILLIFFETLKIILIIYVHFWCYQQYVLLHASLKKGIFEG